MRCSGDDIHRRRTLQQYIVGFGTETALGPGNNLDYVLLPGIFRELGTPEFDIIPGGIVEEAGGEGQRCAIVEVQR